ncbi:hypothetical protein ORI89_16140 [Sphingobacterium sp. UT-1RO-CII-1]|uniref:hypothetical protein n=1 Tax=Sphingobacterium sp. UT-1RO-CII-1 TaxID=2995225 RepID=UPI00227CC43F|nr:hypothetical protein [Sphingobacterium sp. UT-1RO-CII-1]MCY4781193.1 hypothetical protein [Sphingobacterium sp. UT-1RO-CII-1]
MVHHAYQLNKKTRFIFTFFLILISTLSFGVPKYFVIEEDSPKYDIRKYVLNTEDTYGYQGKVELYNILSTAVRPELQDIILFSILPDFENTENWEEIEQEIIKENLLTTKELFDLKEISLFQRFDKLYGEKTKFFNEYILVLKKNDKYFAAKHCLLQFFAVRNRTDIFPNFYGTINILQKPVTITSFKKVFHEQFKDEVFPLETWSVPYSSFDRLRDRREFLSKKFEYNGYWAYQFWTYTDWHEPTYFYEIDRGIDRFVYIPEKGIVGGSFDFYFYFHRKQFGFTIADFKQNMYEEKVMLAQELE